jgi:NADPH:quinone reductase-like Zn-dependent oxidoreductase
MKAVQVNSPDPGPTLIVGELPQPQPGEGQLLIRVCAAGVTPTELSWSPTTHTKEGTPRLHAVPGHEFSGVVAGLGKNASGFDIGQEVYGFNDWYADGATAEFCLTSPEYVAAKPKSLSHEAAASVPIGALTAWQGLFDHAGLKPKERVLVHGAAGSVGVFAVQLAHRHGAHVIATASASHLEFVKELGADEAIDYRASSFEAEAGQVDVVFDGVGGQTRDRSWGILKPGGRLVTIAAESEGTRDQRAKDAFFIVEANQKQLSEMAKLLDSGELKAYPGEVISLPQAPDAYTGSLENQKHGKVIVTLSKA